MAHLHCFKGLKYHEIILICGHMAQNPYFLPPCKMCLMGDIQVGISFSKSDDVQLLRRGIRILSYALSETLNLYRLKILPFEILNFYERYQNHIYCESNLYRRALTTSILGLKEKVALR